MIRNVGYFVLGLVVMGYNPVMFFTAAALIGSLTYKTWRFAFSAWCSRPGSAPARAGAA